MTPEASTIIVKGPTTRPLNVAVLVTLERGPAAGGHVKSWERIAEVAAGRPDLVELDLHFLGDRNGSESAASNVRFHTHTPSLGTRSLRFLDQGAGHTDLARWHGRLKAALQGADVVHATDFFSFGRTAVAHARRTGCGLTASVQTDVPRFTEIYARGIIKRVIGRPIGRVLVDGCGLPTRIARHMQRSIDRRLVACDRVLISKPEDRERLSDAMPATHIRLFRRGIDRIRFNPLHRDRDRLRQAYGIPPDRVVLMFVGRVDSSKSAPLMAKAVKHLAKSGLDVHALVVGEGQDRGRIAAMLGDRVSLPGNLPQSELAWTYASSDVFVFPSATEVSPNVVLEAKASGLPVVVASAHGGGQFVARAGYDGLVLAERDSKAWAAGIRPLVTDPAARSEMGRRAREWIEREWPNWDEVLERDLLAAWREAARNARYANGRYRYVDHALPRTSG